MNEIFFEKRKKIESLINKYSNKYDYNSIGFTYNIDKEFDFYLQKYFIDFEFNNTYDYFEFIENISDTYINKLLKDIFEIKDISENKFNTTFNDFLESLNKGPTYVEKEFIEEIEINNSKCLNLITDLYINISLYLNNTNITESEVYIINNCTTEKIIQNLMNNSYDDICLNISKLNYSYFSKEISIFYDCKNNNNYNISYIVLDIFPETEKIILDEYISNISQILSNNNIDENYLYNYFKKNYVMNTSLEINLDDYDIYFEDIEDMIFYINNLKEPEFKNLMNNLLIESFNISYTNNVKLYISNEIKNKINFIINDKLDVFINYFSNKLKNDFEYYKLLLNQIEELGLSSKSAIKNLFTKIPKKLNESIILIIEDEIFYYIDIFFRENKNIFINNFLNFYLKQEHFNINIYNIKEYVIEMISDRTFNKTLNIISSYLINEMKNKIKESIRNSILAKTNSLIEQSQLISDNIQTMLNQIITKELPEDMETLVELINSYSLLVDNQNNRYNFIMGENPFNILNIFIKEELEPPLLLIYDKYNSIEEQLLNRIQTLAEEFPDCYSEIKNNLLGNKIESIDLLTNEINSTLIEYQNDLINDIKSYINKLIHFTYIDGLQTMEQSCENTDCGIPINNFRRIDKTESLNISMVYKGHSFVINKSELENRINKNVNFKNKRRIASLPDYTPNMGALSEDDMIYYLSDVQNTTLKLNKSFFSKDYINVNLTANKFLSKINFTYLEKLRLIFDIKLVKFATILTENNIQKLKDII